MRILIVDDDFCFANSFADLLVLKGYEVTKAKDGKEALKCLNEIFFDVIFLDLLLPNLDGLQLYRILKGNLPIILISSYSDMIENAKEEGVTYLFSKPLDLEVIFNTLEAVASKL